MSGQSKGKSGNKKHGRNKEKCLKYKMKNKREKNKIRRLGKLLVKAEKLEWGNAGQIRGAIDRAKQRIYSV